jgi:glycosyltransferase involved in cell wall biosynthesis
MKLLLALEQRFRRGPDQHVYADGPASYEVWKTYLQAFEEVVLLVRMGTTDTPCAGELRADGPSVSFESLPDYYGPWQYLRNMPELVRRVQHAVQECDAYILRVPGLVGRLAWKEIGRVRKRYALEVVGDPWDALGPRSARVMFRPVLRSAAVRDLRAMCRGAFAVHYVAQCLKDRYPPSKDSYSVRFPDARWGKTLASASALEARLGRLRNASESRRPVRLGFIGSLSQLYKGLDVLLRAGSLLDSRGLQLEILIAGDGRYAGRMKSLARKLGIEKQTKFLGQLPYGGDIFNLLDSIDLFVMPSYAEGLPRALLEAMARGCPCVGTNVGGISELLAPDDMVPTGNSNALAKKIEEVSGSSSRLREMAQRNFAKASQLSPEYVITARRDFCWFVRTHSLIS